MSNPADFYNQPRHGMHNDMRNEATRGAAVEREKNRQAVLLARDNRAAANVAAANPNPPASAWYPGKELGALANRGLNAAADSRVGRSISSALTDINSGFDTFKDSRIGQMWGGAARGMTGWERAKAGYGPASGLGYGQGGGGDLASMIQNLSPEDLAMLRAMLQGVGTAGDAGGVEVIGDGG